MSLKKIKIQSTSSALHKSRSCMMDVVWNMLRLVGYLNNKNLSDSHNYINTSQLSIIMDYNSTFYVYDEKEKN